MRICICACHPPAQIKQSSNPLTPTDAHGPPVPPAHHAADTFTCVASHRCRQCVSVHICVRMRLPPRPPLPGFLQPCGTPAPLPLTHARLMLLHVLLSSTIAHAPSQKHCRRVCARILRLPPNSARRPHPSKRLPSPGRPRYPPPPPTTHIFATHPIRTKACTPRSPPSTHATAPGTTSQHHRRGLLPALSCLLPLAMILDVHVPDRTEMPPA